MASETGIPGEMKGCKELVQEGMQVRKLELEGTLGETAVVGSLLWASIPNWDRKGCRGCYFPPSPKLVENEDAQAGSTVKERAGRRGPLGARPKGRGGLVN